jgi:transglutaminase-like putative cysteine protease
LVTRYALHQRFRYEYSAPIRRLEHRLIVVPPPVHGDQRVVAHGLRVTGAAARATTTADGFRNHVIELRAPVVERAIEFETWVTVERDGARASQGARLHASSLRDPRYTGPSMLTAPDAHITDVARELTRGRRDPRELAEAVMGWLAATMRYQYGATTVRTTASEALASAAGVCQDYAHVMLAVLRTCGLAARYVSGHLVGEGGSHAWVEVLVPDAHQPQLARAVAFDPTNNCAAGAGYVTVAVGRDYADAAPTSGTFRSPATGTLSCRKRLELAPAPVEAALARS